jgi:hypothetical protein
VGKIEGRRPLRRSRSRWVNNEMNVGGIGSGGMNWIDLA